MGACGGAVGWGCALQTWRSRVQFPMPSLEFFIDPTLPAALWPWVDTASNKVSMLRVIPQRPHDVWRQPSARVSQTLRSRDSHHMSEAKCPRLLTHMPLRHWVDSADFPVIPGVTWQHHTRILATDVSFEQERVRKKYWHLYCCDFSSTLIYAHTTLRTPPTCNMRSGLRTVGVSEAGDCVESVEPYHLGVKGGRCVWSRRLPLSCVDCLESWEPRPPGVHGLSGSEQGFFYASGMLFVTVPKMTLKRLNVNCPRHIHCFHLALHEHSYRLTWIV